MGNRQADGAPAPRLARNAELGGGCRTVFLPTLAELSRWWMQNRGVYSVLAYFNPGTTLVEATTDGNDECEWVAGGSVEQVVAVMLKHIGISPEPERQVARYDNGLLLPPYWNLPDLYEFREFRAMAWQVSADAEALGRNDAARFLLRAFAAGDQHEIVVREGDAIDRLISSELATKADDCIDYYGYQNE